MHASLSPISSCDFLYCFTREVLSMQVSTVQQQCGEVDLNLTKGTTLHTANQVLLKNLLAATTYWKLWHKYICAAVEWGHLRPTQKQVVGKVCRLRCSVEYCWHLNSYFKIEQVHLTAQLIAQFIGFSPTLPKLLVIGNLLSLKQGTNCTAIGDRSMHEATPMPNNQLQ